MLKQGLELKQTQKLSPLQIQTIKLIELPIQELEQKVKSELDLIEKQVIWQMKCLIALFLSLDCIVINIKNPVISFYKTDR